MCRNMSHHPTPEANAPRHFKRIFPIHALTDLGVDLVCAPCKSTSSCLSCTPNMSRFLERNLGPRGSLCAWVQLCPRNLNLLETLFLSLLTPGFGSLWPAVPYGLPPKVIRPMLGRQHLPSNVLCTRQGWALPCAVQHATLWQEVLPPRLSSGQPFLKAQQLRGLAMM